MRAKTISSIVLTLLTIMTLFCTRNKTVWKGTIEEKDGVAIVKNPLEPMYESEILSLEEDLSLGGDQADSAISFSLITDINVDQEGRIHILDNMESHLFIFDESGRLMKTIGREGQGPGELQRPSRIYFSPQNEIVIQDMQRMKLNYFSREGNFIESKLIPFPLIGFGSLFDTDGNLVGLVFTRKDGRETQELRKVDSSFKEVLSIAYIFDPPKNTFVVGSPSIYWRLMPNNNVLFCDTAEYEIKIVNPDGRLIKKIIRKYVPVEFTDEEKEQWLTNQNPVRKIKFEDHRPAIRCLLLSDQGYLIVGTFEKTIAGDRYYYDIFDPEGRFLTQLPLDFQPPRIWKKGKMYFIAEDEDGYQYVKRYKVTWNY